MTKSQRYGLSFILLSLITLLLQISDKVSDGIPREIVGIVLFSWIVGTLFFITEKSQ